MAPRGPIRLFNTKKGPISKVEHIIDVFIKLVTSSEFSESCLVISGMFHHHGGQWWDILEKTDKIHIFGYYLGLIN